MALALLLTAALQAGATPVSSSPVRTFVGNVDFVVTGNTLRTASDAVDPCAVGTSSSATLSGIPADATVTNAFLYWAGSGLTPDFTVTFDGVSVTADTQYTETVSATRSYFSGVEDVTSRISGNGTYSLSGLTVDTGADYCGVSGVLAGWALVAVYQRPAEPFRTINFFEGFQNFWGSSITLTPTNFVIPAGSIDGRLGVLSWEGDSGNSTTRNGVAENLFFDGQTTPVTALTDALNPANNQYNSTLNEAGLTDVWGVDFDVYDISSLLSAGDTSASTTYASGQDRVFLSLEVISVTNTPATDIAVSKTHAGSFAPGHSGAFELALANLGPLDHTATITVTDPLPGGLAMTGFASADANWSCSGTTTVTCTYTGGLANGATTGALTIDVSVPLAASGTLTNVATATSSMFDPIPANNSATDDVDVLTPDLSTSTKAGADSNGGTLLPGDTITWTVSLTDANATQSRVTLTDTLDPLLTNLVVVDAGGGTDASSGTTLTINDLDITPGNTTTVVFRADVLGSAALGSTITNTATATDTATGAATAIVAADLTVANNDPVSGNKPLYLGNIDDQNAPTLPMNLSRTPLTSNSAPANRARIRRQDDDRVWTLTPALAADLTLDGTALSARLLLQRNGSTANRNVRVSVSYGGTLYGCTDATLSASGTSGLSNTVTREFLISVPRSDAACTATGAVPVTIPAGSTLELRIDNEPAAGPTGQAIFVYPFDGALGTTSVTLPATTVINVDSVEFYDAAYPGGSPVSAVAPGETLYIRSLTSDPFGAFDISGVDLEILDAGGTTQATVALEPSAQVATTAASKTHEHAYTVPAAGATGFWTARVTAREGTENTVSHTRAEAFGVTVEPNIVLTKTSAVLSDPTGAANPKGIPGAVVEYTIVLTNLGPGATDADSLVLREDLPPNTRLLFTLPGLEPLTVTQGSPPSGLSYSYVSAGDLADDVAFSFDGGSTFFTPTIDPGSGLDVSPQRINHLRITPGGSLNATATPPSLTITLRVQLD